MDVDHSRSIVHIDIDCFYAQVEMNKNPRYHNVPLGIQQKNIVVTSNYKAREFGIKKCMLLSEAKNLCPGLVLVNGEDLHDYRETSYKVTNLLQQFSSLVERLGLDENFIDVTSLVKERMKSVNDNKVLIGNLFGISENCDCGCLERLTVATEIAEEMRDLIRKDLNLTTCAGIAHNKILAKIVGSKHKPNQQTVIFPNSAVELMLSLNTITDIPGIGHSMCEQLRNIGVHTIEDLQSTSLKKLETILGADKSKIIYDLAYGIDKSLVKSSGKPLSIGLEDSCKTISVEAEVREKLLQLLNRLLLLVSEDGRVPKTIKLTVRKFDKSTKISHRETKQCNVASNAFPANKSVANNNREEKIITTIMHLFHRIIDVKKPFHITLLGLSFTKFQNAVNMKNSLASFLRRDLEVQSVTNIENQDVSLDELNSPTPSTSKHVPECNSPTPSPKKLKLTNLVTNNKKRAFDDFCDDCESPSKLRVADLSLESVTCPPDCDKDVFNELPLELQQELWDEHKRRQRKEVNFCGSQVNKKSKPNTLLNYFVKN